MGDSDDKIDEIVSNVDGNTSIEHIIKIDELQNDIKSASTPCLKEMLIQITDNQYAKELSANKILNHGFMVQVTTRARASYKIKVYIKY